MSFKLYRSLAQDDGSIRVEYMGECVYAEDAARMVQEEWVVKCLRATMWREGYEKFSASESYDRAAEIMHQRLDQRRSELVDD